MNLPCSWVEQGLALHFDGTGRIRLLAAEVHV
jgi:hypothetical protein